MSKTFTYAGVSRLDGSFKVRYANDAMRVKILAKAGHKDIDLIELKHAMTKEDAVAFLLSIDFATRDGVTNNEVQTALISEVERLSEKSEPKTPRSSRAEKPTLEKIKARKPALVEPTKELVEQGTDSALEDAPF